MPTIVDSPLQQLLHASSVLVVGASPTRPSATGNQVVRTLRSEGFRGRIEILHPSGGDVEGIVTTASLGATPPADTAVVAVRPDAVVPVLKQIHDGGTKSAVVVSVGLSDDQLRELRAFADTSGMVIHGPNCMGLLNLAENLMIWADEGVMTGLPLGDIALISQSGSGAMFVARSMTGVGFSYVISTGNETVVSSADYIDALVDDDRTAVIGLILESVHDAPHLGAALDRARAAGKPVVALKVGRTLAGARATVAHTGAVVSDSAVATAFFEHHGVPLVDDYDELAAALELLSHLHGRSVKQGRAAIVTISGGQAALSADLAERHGVALADLSTTTRSALADILPGAMINNPLDVGGSIYADEDSYANSIAALVADPGVDVIVAITDSQETLNAVEIAYEDDMIVDVRAAASSSDKVFVIASSSSVSLHPTRIPSPLEDVPVLRGISNALRAISVAARATLPAASGPGRPSHLPTPERVLEIRAELLRGPSTVDGGVTRGLLSEYGLHFVQTRSCFTVEEAVEVARDFGYPVVAKIDSPDIAHKSEAGGVVLGIADETELRRAWSRILHDVRSAHPYATVRGIELQEQVGPSIEALVGVVADLRIGAAVVVGMGGVLVELLNDSATAFAPLSRSRAQDLLDSTRLSRLLDGYRNLHPSVDTSALIDVIEAVSWLAHDLRGVIAEFDANPVLVEPASSRVRLIDALLVVENPSSLETP